MDQANHAQGGHGHQSTSASHYDPVHAASSETSPQHSLRPAHAPGQQTNLGSSLPMPSGSTSAGRPQGSLPSLRSSIGSLTQEAASVAPWNQWDLGLPANPLLPSPGQMTSPLFGEWGQVGWAPQTPATPGTESRRATSRSHSHRDGNPLFMRTPTTTPSNNATGRHPSTHSAIPNPPRMQGSSSMHNNNFTQATGKPFNEPYY